MPRLKVTTYISYIQKKKIYCKKHYICPKIITQNIFLKMTGETLGDDLSSPSLLLVARLPQLVWPR